MTGVATPIPPAGAGEGRRPVIGMCAAYEVAAWSVWRQHAHLVPDTYVSEVQRAGGLAIALPVDANPEPLLDLVDGLLLVGGADVDPSMYGAERDPLTEATVPRRDEFEIALVRLAAERDVPVLGICRGMQIINVAFGGTLRQHVTDETGATTHRRRLGGFEGTDHIVDLDAGSLAAQLAGETEHCVHCHHHQAIDAVGAGLIVTGRGRDGMPEALEAADGRWLVGVQWHPEAVVGGPVLRSFVAECAARAEQRGESRGRRQEQQRGVSGGHPHGG